ncbi:MAG: FMN-binding glutamate synthase family protein [Bacilli bacterium]|nr:FMN-binding glutamate synthase family protein [Bacilli bacterium]
MKNILLKILKPIIDKSIKDIFTKDYAENDFINITAVQKLGLKNIVDCQLRAEKGKILSIPYGSNINFSPWDKLLLNPRQLFEMPTESVNMIKTEVIIGKNAKRPLKLSMPIMITGMSYGGSLSLRMKIALAKGASKVGISTNTGESVLTKEVRKHARYVIGQIHRADLMRDEDLKELDAIEIRFGQGAWGGLTESTMYAKDIRSRLGSEWGLNGGGDVKFKARVGGINSKGDLIKLVNKLKKDYEVPIGIKIAGTGFIEQELDVITSTKCDYIVIDGCEGGTAKAPPTLEDHMGLPTLYALIRAVNYLEKNNIRDKYDLIITGGLTNPGQFLKALALGANAVYIGSIALFAVIHNQAVKAMPKYPPTQLALYTGKVAHKLDINLAAISLSNFLISCKEEMKLALQGMGKKDIKDLTTDDLVSLDKEISNYTDIRYALDKRINNNE